MTIVKKPLPPRWTKETTRIMRHLHDSGKTPQQIAYTLGFVEATVRTRMAKEGLVPNSKPLGGRGLYEKQYRMAKEKPDPLRLAKWAFNAEFDREKMTLHGNPIKFHELMRETNRRLKALDMEQWSVDPSCLV